MTEPLSSIKLPDPAPKKPNKYLLAGGICLIVLLAYFVYKIYGPMGEVEVQAKLREVQTLASQGKCTEIMPIVNELIENKPDLTLPYEYRASCNLAFKSNVFTEAQGFLLAALQDANTLVELQPTSGGYYAWRNYILREMALLEVSSVNIFAIYDYANQNAVKAMELGVDPPN